MKKVLYLGMIALLTTSMIVAQGKSKNELRKVKAETAEQTVEEVGKRVEKADKDLETEKKGNAYGTQKGDLSGKEFGAARSEAARQKAAIEQASESVKSSEAKIKVSNDKVKEVKEKMERERKTGRLSSEAYEEKSRRIQEIEERLKAELDIPIMHDDQHGTAIISSAGLLNALEITGKKFEDLKIELPYQVVAARVNNKIESLNYCLYRNKTIEFVDLSCESGMRVYVRSLVFVLFKSIVDLIPNGRLRVEHPVSKGYYCEITANGEKISFEQLAAIKIRMKEIIEQNIRFVSEDKPT